MPKQEMNKQELVSFIKSQHERNRATGINSKESFKKITQELKSRGVKSDRTGKPLSADYVRYVHTYGYRGAKSGKAEVSEQPENENKLNLLQTILDSPTLNSDAKVEMMQLLLKNT